MAANALLDLMLRQSPEVLWLLDDSRIATDLSGRARDGVATGTFDPAQAGGLVPAGGVRHPYLPGGGLQYWTGAYEAGLDVGTGDFAMEMWLTINRDAGGFIQLGGRDLAASGNGVLMYIVGGSGVLRGYCGGGQGSGTTILTNERKRVHHLMLSRGSGTVRGFVDGRQEFTYAAAGSINLGATNGRLRVGAIDGSFNRMVGHMGYFAWYNRALSELDARNRWELGRGLVVPATRRRHR